MGNVQASPPGDVVPTFDPALGFSAPRKERGKQCILLKISFFITDGARTR